MAEWAPRWWVSFPERHPTAAVRLWVVSMVLAGAGILLMIWQWVFNTAPIPSIAEVVGGEIPTWSTTTIEVSVGGALVFVFAVLFTTVSASLYRGIRAVRQFDEAATENESRVLKVLKVSEPESDIPKIDVSKYVRALPYFDTDVQKLLREFLFSPQRQNINWINTEFLTETNYILPVHRLGEDQFLFEIHPDLVAPTKDYFAQVKKEMDRDKLSGILAHLSFMDDAEKRVLARYAEGEEEISITDLIDAEGLVSAGILERNDEYGWLSMDVLAQEPVEKIVGPLKRMTLYYDSL